MGLQSTLPHKSTHSTSGSDPLTPAQIGAATAAQGAKADTASQPGHTHTISNIIDFVGVTNFQPSPEYLSDEVSGITVTSSIGANDSLQKIADYWASGDWAVTKNGPTGTWLLEFIGDGSPASVASTNATQFPWQATWPNGTIVVKTQVTRLVGTSLASMASEGTSSYQARADHVHPLPSALQVGAAPLQSGKIPSQYLPSYVDDVVEYATIQALQADTTNGRDSGKIYVARNTNKIYRWSGSTHIEISNSLELGEFQIPDSRAGISFDVNGNGDILSLNGTQNGKNSYSGGDGDAYSYQVFWTGTAWKGTFQYSGDGDLYEETTATGNTQYPWQATGWTNSGSVTRVGTYNANLAPSPLSADAYSGAATKAARADHVHAWPTPADIGAATTVQGAKADSALQSSALMPYRTSAAQDTIDAGKAPALSSNPNVASFAAGLYDEPNGSVQLQIRNSQVIIGDNLVKATFRSAIGAATAEQGAKADTALQPTTTPLIPLLFGHSSYSYAAGGQTRFFSQIFDLSVAANSTARNFRFPANCTIKRAIFTVYNGGANAAAGHSGATLRLRNNSGGTSVNILSYNLNGLATEGSCSWRVIDLSIEGNISNDYVIEMETGTFSVAPTSVRQTLALYYL